METEDFRLENCENSPRPNWRRKVDFALKKSCELDQTENIDQAREDFKFLDCKHMYWNPEKFSFLWGTWLWEQASPAQKVALNQIYWVAYYSQIISAEIATIYFNQASAAALYSIPDFRSVCDTLDLESSQERAHIHAFAEISRQTEMALFKKRILSYEMRGPFEKTMLYSDLGTVKKWIRKWQLKFYPMLASGSAYIGAQYFTVRALRTLNGKIIQDQLSKMVRFPQKEQVFSIPSQVSYFHFMDESFHFNTSMVISKEVTASLPAPTGFEKLVTNLAIQGCQRDHYHFSTAINGIFWFDPALYQITLDILKSPVFQMTNKEALDCIGRIFCEESEGLLESEKTHKIALESYLNYLADTPDLWKSNREMAFMKKNNLQKHLQINRRWYAKFRRAMDV